jgi:hypothetical protein
MWKAGKVDAGDRCAADTEGTTLDANRPPDQEARWGPAIAMVWVSTVLGGMRNEPPSAPPPATAKWTASSAPAADPISVSCATIAGASSGGEVVTQEVGHTSRGRLTCARRRPGALAGLADGWGPVGAQVRP